MRSLAAKIETACQRVDRCRELFHPGTISRTRGLIEITDIIQTVQKRSAQSAMTDATTQEGGDTIIRVSTEFIVALDQSLQSQHCGFAMRYKEQRGLLRIVGQIRDRRQG